MKKLVKVIEDRNRALRPVVSGVEELLGIVRGFAAEEIDKGLVRIKEGDRGFSFHFLVPSLGVDLLFLAFDRLISVWVRTESLKKYGGYDLVKNQGVGFELWLIRRTNGGRLNADYPLDADTFDQMITDLVDGARP